jgi:hypothetical protein
MPNSMISTCRIYARRARFKPGLDAEGKPVAAHFADRIRWELPTVGHENGAVGGSLPAAFDQCESVPM